jgi:hypothetical protein
MLTGGEPMLVPNLVKGVITDIRKQTIAPIYVYTANVTNIPEALSILELANGLTITLHTDQDVINFLQFEYTRRRYWCDSSKSLRLNVFERLTLLPAKIRDYKIKDNMRWIKDCPLPTDEVFMRL